MDLNDYLHTRDQQPVNPQEKEIALIKYTFIAACALKALAELALLAMGTYGADSFVGRLACVAQGSTDTAFYIVAVYYGSVAIRRTRYTIPCALIADLAGAITAILMTYLFFR